LEFTRQQEGTVTEQEKPAGSAVTQDDQQRISIEDFAKVDMRVAKIVAAERVSQSEKLVKLQVDIGTEIRQVVAGIGKAYDPEVLLGRYVVVVTNLKPAKLMGQVSDGMIVAASQGGVPVLVGFSEPVEIGARLK
jgi:methionyl-tRNA synthetase